MCVCIQRVEEETLVKNSSACKDYLIEAMKYHLLPTEQRSMMKTIRTRARTPISYPKVCLDYYFYLIFLTFSLAVKSRKSLDGDRGT